MRFMASWKRNKFNSKQEVQEFIKKGGDTVQQTKIYESINLKPEYMNVKPRTAYTFTSSN